MEEFERVWEYREEVAYPRIFGGIGHNIHALTPDIFKDSYDQTDLDPSWMFHGILESAPNEKRDSWLYVTSGMSNAWGMEAVDYRRDQPSGLGIEMVLEAPSQAPWALGLIANLMAYNLLVAAGRYGDRPVFGYGHRMALQESIAFDRDSDLRCVVFARPSHYDHTVVLDSGTLRFLHVVGIADAELEYAKRHTTRDLIDRLQVRGAYPVTDPDRASIL